MHRVGFACAISTLLVALAGLFVLGSGCDEYFTKPEPETWTDSVVPGHLAVVFNGKGDTGDRKYTFSNTIHPAYQYGFARLALMIQLEEGTAQITISESGNILVDTSGTPGWGPWVRCDIAENLPGEYDVRIQTLNAKGMISIQIDEMDPSGPQSRIGFEYNCTFPDSETIQVAVPPVNRTEIYSWDNPNTTADLMIKASILYTDMATQFTVEDATTPTRTVVYDHQVWGTILRTSPPPHVGVEWTEGDPGPYVIPQVGSGTAGTWRITIAQTEQGHDAALQLTLE